MKIDINNSNFSSPQLLFLSYLGVLCPGFLGSGVDGVRVAYAITWFCSWSPCSNCAHRLSRFMSQMPNLRLRIFVARLYFCDEEDSQEREGLRCLQRAGVQVTVMTYKGKKKRKKRKRLGYMHINVFKMSASSDTLSINLCKYISSTQSD